MNVRLSLSGDIPALQAVLDQTGLFPGEMLPGLMSGFLSSQDSEDLWLTCEIAGEVAGFCYCAPEKLTDGTWNMLAIAVHPSMQGSGCGGAIVKALEELLQARGQRVVIADTSGTDGFARTRAFYRKNGYREEARIRDFWAAGDDKIVFWKNLGPAA
jgi:ribosomal protein S18 acetylase RimI-like enzyme